MKYSRPVDLVRGEAVLPRSRQAKVTRVGAMEDLLTITPDLHPNMDNADPP